LYFPSRLLPQSRLTSYQDQIDSDEKKVHLSIWDDYLEISPLFEFAIILIPEEFQFSLQKKNSFSEIFPRFSSLGYILFVVCENLFFWHR
jgi:hypothetical protein